MNDVRMGNYYRHNDKKSIYIIRIEKINKKEYEIRPVYDSKEFMLFHSFLVGRYNFDNYYHPITKHEIIQAVFS